MQQLVPIPRQRGLRLAHPRRLTKRVLAVALIVMAIAHPVYSQPDGAIELLSCPFDTSWDANYDGHPDGWTRKLGRNYPSWISAEIEADESASHGRALVVRLDGGGMQLTSKPVAVHNYFTYQAQARIRTKELEFGKAFIALQWFDRDGKELQQSRSSTVQGDQEWTTLEIGPMTPPATDAVMAKLSLVVEPGARPDLTSVIGFDDIWVGRLPRLQIVGNQPFNLFEAGSPVEVDCRLSGLRTADPEIKFSLYDLEGNEIDSAIRKVETTPVTIYQAAQVLESSRVDDAGDGGYQGTATWAPRVPGEGFYRIRAALLNSTDQVRIRESTLAVLRDVSHPNTSPFGWSLVNTALAEDMDGQSRLLPRAGIHHVKLPLSIADRDPSYAEKILQTAEHLSTFNIEVIGVLDQPPQIGGQHSTTTLRTAADWIALDPSHWVPKLEPIISRLALRIRTWQLGNDDDLSFVGHSRIAELVTKVREHLFRFNQDVKLGINGRFMYGWSQQNRSAWQFVQFHDDVPLTADEILAYTTKHENRQTMTWIDIQPLSPKTYDLTMRTRDLIFRMMAIRRSETDAAFINRPFDPAGLFREDEGPRELFLPWRNASMLLGDTRYIGSLSLPGGSQNQVFRGPNDKIVMVIWNAFPTTESIFLGDNVTHFDPWGRDITIGEDDGSARQVLEVSRLPTFVVGLDAQLTQWRLAVRFERDRIPSVFGRRHENKLHLHNSYPHGVGGVVRFVGPKDWKIDPKEIRFKGASHQNLAEMFTITPLYSASTGKQRVRLEFEMTANRRIKFDVYRELEIGLGEIDVEITSRIESDGSLLVEQRSTNHTDQLLDFKCLLYAPDRRRLQKTIYQLRDGQDIKYYRYPRGEELVGKELLLRLEEIGGARVFNYRIKVER